MAYPTTQEITDLVKVIDDQMPSEIGPVGASLATLFQMIVSLVGRVEALEAKPTKSEQ